MSRSRSLTFEVLPFRKDDRGVTLRHPGTFFTGPTVIFYFLWRTHHTTHPGVLREGTSVEGPRFREGDPDRGPRAFGEVVSEVETQLSNRNRFTSHSVLTENCRIVSGEGVVNRDKDLGDRFLGFFHTMYREGPSGPLRTFLSVSPLSTKSLLPRDDPLYSQLRLMKGYRDP